MELFQTLSAVDTLLDSKISADLDCMLIDIANKFESYLCHAVYGCEILHHQKDG